jgi:hypothetical protein
MNRATVRKTPNIEMRAAHRTRDRGAAEQSVVPLPHERRATRQHHHIDPTTPRPNADSPKLKRHVGVEEDRRAGSPKPSAPDPDEHVAERADLLELRKAMDVEMGAGLRWPDGPPARLPPPRCLRVATNRESTRGIPAATNAQRQPAGPPATAAMAPIVTGPMR